MKAYKEFDIELFENVIGKFFASGWMPRKAHRIDTGTHPTEIEALAALKAEIDRYHKAIIKAQLAAQQ